MKVLFLHDNPPIGFGGATNSTYEIALGMKNAGHEVFAITTCREQSEAGEFNYQGIKYWKIATDYPDRWRAYVSLYNPRVCRQVDRILAKIKPDVVHASNIHQYLSYHCFKIAKRHAKVVCLTARDLMVFNYGKLMTSQYLENLDTRTTWRDHMRQARKRWNPFRNFLIKRYLKYVDQIFALSNALKEALEQNGIKNVHVMHTGINVDLWSVDKDEAIKFRKIHNLENKKLILFGGRLGAAKGAEKSIEALFEIAKQEPDAVLLVAGKLDWYAEVMREKAKSLGVENNLVFTGWVDKNDMKNVYSASDIVLVPSMYLDPFPRIMVEAMACGKPVVGSRYGGAPEIVIDGVTGYIINPLYPKQIALKILDLLKNPEKVEAFGQAGRERVKDNFRLEDKIKAHLSFYKAILDKKKSVLVVFDAELPRGDLSSYGTILYGEELEKFIEPGSVYEASNLLKELSQQSFGNKERVAKSFNYNGYDLWWIHYNSLFYYCCIPYTQYKKLLLYLKEFQKVYFYHPPYSGLFSSYLKAYGCEMKVLDETGLRIRSVLPFGILIQIVITLLSLPILTLIRRRLLVFIGDKFESGQDYDFRMKYIYEELRTRNMKFVEFIRSPESWKTVLHHAFVRKRPVIYSEAVAYIGQLLSIFSGGRRRARKLFGFNTSAAAFNPEERFKLLVATEYLWAIYDDIWAIRLMKIILYIIGIKVAMLTATNERNFHTVLACKINNIPTVGILHGVASRYSTPYDYMSGFKGEKMFSVDTYGVWSEWWKEHYIKESDAYRPEQLYVSGPMRPITLAANDQPPTTNGNKGPVKVLFVAEQAAAPLEVMSYLHKLIEEPDIKLAIKFRPVGDRFESWLLEHESNVFKSKNIQIIKGNIQDAIKDADVVVGCHSTAVLEALLQLKVPIFLYTRKWGDYFGMAQSSERQSFLADNPEKLIELAKKTHTIPSELLVELREQYFGDPHKNGSAWIVERAERLIGSR